MKKITFYFVLVSSLITTLNTYSQCTPTGTRPIFGTVNGTVGTSFSNIPTGNVIQINPPAVGTYYTFDMWCTKLWTSLWGLI